MYTDLKTSAVKGRVLKNASFLSSFKEKILFLQDITDFYRLLKRSRWTAVPNIRSSPNSGPVHGPNFIGETILSILKRNLNRPKYFTGLGCIVHGSKTTKMHPGIFHRIKLSYLDYAE